MQISRRYILIIILILILSGALLFLVFQKKPSAVGSSTFPALDIVSGEISTSDQKNVIGAIESISSKSIVPSDVSIRKNSYTKEFSNQSNYTISFITDIQKVKSSYLITVSHNVDTPANQVRIDCATSQKPNYKCYNVLMEPEYG